MPTEIAVHSATSAGDASERVEVRDGAYCAVVAGTHAGKTGTVRDIKTSKTGQITITVVQDSGVRFKTLAKNVAVQSRARR